MSWKQAPEFQQDVNVLIDSVGEALIDAEHGPANPVELRDGSTITFQEPDELLQLTADLFTRNDDALIMGGYCEQLLKCFTGGAHCFSLCHGSAFSEGSILASSSASNISSMASLLPS